MRDGRQGGRTEPPRALAARIGRWRGLALAAIAGALSNLAMAPLLLWPVLFVTLPALVLALDGAGLRLKTCPRRRAAAFAAVGWTFGFGYFLPGLSWMGEAFLVEADKFAWLMPFAVTLMPAGLAAFFALAAASVSLAWQEGPSRIAVLALALSMSEWLRGHVLTGLPWNDLGYALTGSAALMQLASLVGVSGLAFWSVLIFASPAAVLSQGSLSRRAALPLATLAVLALAALWGSLRIPTQATPDTAGIRLRIVQPDIPQREKWQGANKERIFSTFLQLTGGGDPASPAGLAGISHVIWPESSLPFLMLQSSEAMQRIGTALPEGVTLLAGSLRAEGTGAGQRLRVYNSLAAVDSEGRTLAIYDKRHLVPFGEYLPFQAALEALGLEQLTRLKGGFEAGVNPRRLDVPGLPPLVPLICYEAIFPDAVREAEGRPRWLLNVTNDAWFGQSSGPYQHFHQARLRAVESGLPLVRAANTGISAVVDPYGRIVRELPLGSRGVLDGGLPEALEAPIYARMGDLMLLFEVLGALIILYVRRAFVGRLR